MMKRVTIAMGLVLAGFGLGIWGVHAAEEEGGPVYSVDVYDPKRDAAKDLEATVERAEMEGRRILLQLGGDWCGWCRAMSKFFHENEKVAAKLAEIAEHHRSLPAPDGLGRAIGQRR